MTPFPDLRKSVHITKKKKEKDKNKNKNKNDHNLVNDRKRDRLWTPNWALSTEQPNSIFSKQLRVEFKIKSRPTYTHLQPHMG